jgi:predicted nucleic acid-binding Zn ribbon protein
MSPKPEQKTTGFDALGLGEPSTQDEQVASLQEKLAHEKDARQQERFIFIVVVVLLLNVVFFSVLPTFGGPLALILLELLILIPLAKRMGMEEIAELLSRLLDHMAGKTKGE